MEGSHLNRNVLVLLGIGLVLAGLLTGILIMLFMVDLRPQAANAPPVASQVEIGRQEPIRRVFAPDTISPVGGLEMATLNHWFKDVSAQVTPSVVYIQVEVPASESLPKEWLENGNPHERFFRDRAPRQSVGSGVIITDQGHIITNNHVVENASRIQVTLSDKRQYSARVVGTDVATDLAVIRVENVADLPVIVMGNSDEVTVGEWVLAVGNPFRLTSTVTAGIVSALGRQVNIIEDRFGIEDFIQTDAAINPGNSGGALVNMNGELIGISTAIATESGSYEGYGFAVPANLMQRVASDLISFGEVQRGFLGVTIQEVDSRDARRLGLERVRGVYLAEVTHGGAADKGGLREGDVVLSIDGTLVDAPNELQRTIAQRRPGDLLAIEVWRRGARKVFRVELYGREDPSYRSWFSELDRLDQPQEMPDREAEPPAAESTELSDWGIGLQALTSRDRDAFEGEGAYVAYIKNGSVSSQGGLPRDVVITRVGDREVTTMDEAREAFEQAAEREESVVVRVKRRDGLNAFYEIEAPAQR